MANKTTRQQLRAAEKVAAAYPLFADQLAPELPVLAAHVAEHGSRDIIPEPAAFAVGTRVQVADTPYHHRVCTGTVRLVKPSWAYDGRWYRWVYYVTYDPGQNVPNFHEELPVWPNNRISLLPHPQPNEKYCSDSGNRPG